ncbi:MAG: serine/threonine-protein kinase [Kofleriaceae bacterium]|nr:serine/threonine-protein kinase [Kofleriaceae bacterium]
MAASVDGSFARGLVGIVLDGRYRLDALLGEGGMGAVFRAQQLAMDRRVAVKLLKPHLTQNAEAAERFVREARSTLKVESPHVAKVFDFGITPHGDYYIAMEYLDGRTAQRELEIDGPFSPARTLHVARHALHALGAAHKRGLVHRDLKPENLLLMRVGDDPDYTKLLDFGVAKLMQGAEASSRSQLALTQAGTVYGTPEFMSPEQACGHPLDGRSDLYSLAATMFTMLTGCPLFEGGTALEWLTHHVRTPPPRLAQVSPELGEYPELDDLLQRCLAKHREQRTSSAEELDNLLAKLEVYVSRGGARARGGQRVKSPLTASAYFPALPADLVDPGKTLLPERASAETIEPPTRKETPVVVSPPETGFTDAVAAVASPRRGVWLALGGLVVLGMIAFAIIASTRKRGDQVTTAPPPVARVANALLDAGAMALDAAVVVDAPVVVDVAVPPDAAPARPHSPPPSTTPRSSAAVEHLRNAEAAHREGNKLRQLAEADLALKADPRNVRAKYLLADALIKSGDLDRGCAYLRALGRNPLAVARASSAKCPTD